MDTSFKSHCKHLTSKQRQKLIDYIQRELQEAKNEIQEEQGIVSLIFLYFRVNRLAKRYAYLTSLKANPSEKVIAFIPRQSDHRK